VLPDAIGSVVLRVVRVSLITSHQHSDRFLSHSQGENVIATKHRTGTAPRTTNFAEYEVNIRKGNQVALRNWWKAAQECLSKWDGKAQPYAIACAKVSEDWKMNTIRQYMMELMFLIKQGHKCDEFKSLEHARETKASYASPVKPKQVIKFSKDEIDLVRIFMMNKKFAPAKQDIVLKAMGYK